MDSKRKEKSWLGSVYNQLETLCKDFDTVISKEPVKSIESQKKSVGIGFYADILELPPSGANGEHTEPEMSKVVERNSMESVTSISMPICLIENQLSVDPSQEFLADLPLREDHDDVALNEVANSSKEDVTKNSWPIDSNSSSSTKTLETCDDYATKSTLLIADSNTLPNQETEILETTEETMSGNGFLEEDFNPRTYTSGWLLEGDLPFLEKSNCTDQNSKAHEDKSQEMSASSSSGFDTGSKSLSEDGGLWDDFSIEDESPIVSNNVQSSEVLVTYFSCKNGKEDMGIISSTSESPLKNTTLAAETICGSIVTIAYEAKTTVMTPTESNSPGILEHFDEKAQSKCPVSPSAIDKSSLEFDVGFTDADMESIDLTSIMEHDGRNLLPDGNFINPSFNRRKDLRYYKNLMRDTLTSRKRLSKEYEHLGMWYGDIDMESRNNFQLSSLPSSHGDFGNPQRPTHSSSMCESEWELL